jgi:hypothetical protein
MPAQKCLRPHDQALSAPVREQPRERRKEGTVRGPQRRAASLPAEHNELMSEHEQLDVFGELAAPASDKQPQNRREREIGEGEEHPPMLPDSPPPAAARPRNRGFETPQGANPLQLAEALGHTDRTGRPDPTLVWKRYGHLYPGSTREAAAALDRHLKAAAS